MRVFIAIDLPPDLKEKIFEVSQKIVKQFPLRLVAKENLHLTLVFLGERNREEAEKIKKAVADAISGYGKIFLTVENLEFFPQGKPRGIWFKIGGETEKLKQLHKKIIDELLKQKIQVEDLRFTPHSCIGRFTPLRPAKGGASLGAREEVEKIYLRENFFAEKVTVFESKLSSKGPTYYKLGEFSLKLT